MILVDTNILVYRAIPSPRSEEAAQLAMRDPYWSAPALWRSEMRNVLAGYLRRQTFGESRAAQLIHLAASFLQGGEHSVDETVLFQLIGASNCTTYDCEFVALAIQLDVPLVTEDRALLRSFPDRSLSLAQALTRL